MPKIRINQFHNGWSKYESQGYPGQFSKSRAINVRNVKLGTMTLNYGGNRQLSNSQGVPFNLSTPTYIQPGGTRGLLYYHDPTQKYLYRYNAGTGQLTQLSISITTCSGIFEINNRIYYSCNLGLRYYDENTTTDNSYQTLGAINVFNIGFLKNGKLYITNGQTSGTQNTIASIDGSNNYNGSELLLPTGYTAIDICDWQEYLVILCKRPDGKGMLLYWAQDSTTAWDFAIPIEDIPQFCWNDNGDVRVCAGNRLDFYKVERTFAVSHLIWENCFDPTIAVGAPGGYSVNPFQKVVINNILHFAVSQTTYNANIDTGVYSYGTRDPQVPPSFNSEFILSTGNTANTATITNLTYSVASLVQALYIGWNDSTQIVTTGLDLVPDGAIGNPISATPVFYESLVFDGGNPEVLKSWDYFAIGLKSFGGPSTVFRLKMKIDDNPTWQTISSPSILQKAKTHNTDPVLMEWPNITGQWGYRCQFRVEIDNTVNTGPTPIINQFVLGYDNRQSRTGPGI